MIWLAFGVGCVATIAAMLFALKFAPELGSADRDGYSDAELSEIDTINDEPRKG